MPEALRIAHPNESVADAASENSQVVKLNEEQRSKIDLLLSEDDSIRETYFEGMPSAD